MVEFIKVDGHKLAYSEHNPSATNTPIVFIHGVLNTINMPIKSLTDILAGQRWISLSLPGHHPSTFKSSFQTEQFTADFVGNTLAQGIRQIFKNEPVHLIGHSTGGFSCLAIAHADPDLVQSICLIDAFAQGNWYSLALRPLQMMATTPIIGSFLFTLYMTAINGNSAMIKLFLRFISYDYGNVRSADDYTDRVQLITAEAKQHHIPSLYHYFHMMPTTDIRPWLPEINCPAIVLHGKQDSVILPSHGQEMHDLLPNSAIVWFDDCGHDPFAEAYDSLKSTIQRWIAEQEALALAHKPTLP